MIFYNLFSARDFTLRQLYCSYKFFLVLLQTSVCGVMVLVLSGVTFDHLVELPGVGPIRVQQFLQLREELGLKVTAFFNE